MTEFERSTFGPLVTDVFSRFLMRKTASVKPEPEQEPAPSLDEPDLGETMPKRARVEAQDGEEDAAAAKKKVVTFAKEADVVSVSTAGSGGAEADMSDGVGGDQEPSHVRSLCSNA